MGVLFYHNVNLILSPLGLFLSSYIYQLMRVLMRDVSFFFFKVSMTKKLVWSSRNTCWLVKGECFNAWRFFLVKFSMTEKLVWLHEAFAGLFKEECFNTWRLILVKLSMTKKLVWPWRSIEVACSSKRKYGKCHIREKEPDKFYFIKKEGN